MQKYSKYVNAVFVLAAGLVWLVTSHYLSVVIAYFQLGRRLGGNVEILQHALPILLGLAAFLLLRRYAVTYNFTADSVSELVKVHWPSTKEVRLGTIVVIVTVLVSGVLLGALDVFLSALVKAILGT